MVELGAVSDQNQYMPGTMGRKKDVGLGEVVRPMISFLLMALGNMILAIAGGLQIIAFQDLLHQIPLHIFNLAGISSIMAQHLSLAILLIPIRTPCKGWVLFQNLRKQRIAF